MREFHMIDSGEFCQFLEDWIIDNKCNPSTPEEWARFEKDLIASRKTKYLGIVSDKDALKIKKELLDQPNIKELKDEDS